MKRFYGFILILISIFSFYSINAQTFCAGITTTSFPKSTQSGGVYYYYGVRVTLDRAYDQNITVSGTITEVGGQNVTSMFEVTVTAGYLTGQTSETFYAASWQGTVSIDVESISPSTVTGGGITLSTQCVSGSTPTDFLNAAGQLHNDYQDYVLSYLISENTDLSDTSTLKSTIDSKTTEFFESHNIERNDSYTFNFGAAPVTSFNASSNDYSSAALDILDDLETLINSYNPANDASFFSSLNTLKASALNLSNPIEVYNVGAPVTIAIYSFNYWKNRGDSIAEIFWEQDSIRNLAFNKYPTHDDLTFQSSSNQKNYFLTASQVTENPVSEYYNWIERKNLFKSKCHVSVGQLGVTDAVGAVRGAMYGGIGGGPLGAVAGATCVGAMSSIGNIAGQLMGCLFSWW